MKILVFGSRSLTWKHLPVFRAVALHSTLELGFENGGGVPIMSMELMTFLLAGGDDHWSRHPETMTLLNGDGPPGRERGAIGADKLAVLACMEGWHPGNRRMRWFPPEPTTSTETWAQAAGRRNREMVEARPDRAYCVHTDLDSSKGSSMTASLLTSAGIPFWYLRVTPAGAVVSVEERR